MKKVLMIVAALALVAGSVSAGPLHYIGLYTDAGHSVCRADIPAPYVGFTTYVWMLPADTGIICAEFKLTAPAWLLNIGTVENPGKSVVLGTPYGVDGVSFCFANCQTDWVWLFEISQLPTAAALQDFVYVGIRPDAGAYQVASCLPDYPIEPLTILNHLALNQDCIVAAESSTWGAIKGMYNE